MEIRVPVPGFEASLVTRLPVPGMDAGLATRVPVPGNLMMCNFLREEQVGPIS